jgi:ABC-type sugar transport system ATPase subunit
MLRLNNIYKRMGNFTLDGINLDIQEGEYYVLLGRSGAGKTQLLELIAGLEKPDSGNIFLDGVDITTNRIQERRIGIVFQDYAIFPHMTVYGNISYPLRARKTDDKTVSLKVTQAAGQMNIIHLLNRTTTNLSGGERQRIALARTLITSPRLLLLDEPLASLDATLKDDLKKLLRNLNRNGQTIIHVTHDYGDAISLAGRVGVIHNGKIIQEGSVDDVFRKPVNRFVARYAGIRNFFKLTVSRENGVVTGVTPFNTVFRLAEDPGYKDCLAFLKSDNITVSKEMTGERDSNIIKCRVDEIIRTEFGFELSLDSGDTFYTNLGKGDFEKLGIRCNEEVWISFAADALILLSGHAE